MGLPRRCAPRNDGLSWAVHYETAEYKKGWVRLVALRRRIHPATIAKMKRYGNLFSQIISFENLYLASRKARKGKREKSNVILFETNIEDELLRLQAGLASKSYFPLKHMAPLYRQMVVSFGKMDASVQSWLGHDRHADSYGLRKSILNILNNVVFSQQGWVPAQL